MHVRKNQDGFEEIIIRYKGIKGDCDEVSDRNEEHVTGPQRKGDPCHKVAKSLAELFSPVLWKAGFVSNEPEYVAEEISTWGIEGMAWVLLTAYSKVQKERDRLKDLWSKEGPEPEDLENLPFNTEKRQVWGC